MLTVNNGLKIIMIEKKCNDNVEWLKRDQVDRQKKVIQNEKREKKSIEDFQVSQKNDEVVSLETKIRFIIKVLIVILT